MVSPLLLVTELQVFVKNLKGVQCIFINKGVDSMIISQITSLKYILLIEGMQQLKLLD